MNKSPKEKQKKIKFIPKNNPQKKKNLNISNSFQNELYTLERDGGQIKVSCCWLNLECNFGLLIKLSLPNSWFTLSFFDWYN